MKRRWRTANKDKGTATTNDDKRWQQRKQVEETEVVSWRINNHDLFWTSDTHMEPGKVKQLWYEEEENKSERETG